MTADSTTAADLAAVLGTVRQQVATYNTERQKLADSLRQIVASAQQLLSELGEPAGQGTTPRRRGRPPGGAKTAAAPAGRRGPGRPPGGGKKRGARKGRKLSAETRKKMADAAKKRWAAKKKGGGE